MAVAISSVQGNERARRLLWGASPGLHTAWWQGGPGQSPRNARCVLQARGTTFWCPVPTLKPTFSFSAMACQHSKGFCACMRMSAYSSDMPFPAPRLAAVRQPYSFTAALQGGSQKEPCLSEHCNARVQPICVLSSWVGAPSTPAGVRGIMYYGGALPYVLDPCASCDVTHIQVV